ncbi:MAG: chemotaxis protein CheA [Planctomycetota bacterium]|nr:chemotaxis protein CheA [Planctomycetota bacterium]
MSDAPDMSGIDPALLQDFISESQEILDGLDPLFVALEANPEDHSIIDGIFRPVHSVKGNSGFFGLTNIKNFAHIMENILGEIRARKRHATPPLVDLLLKGVDFLRGMLNRLAAGDLSGQFLPEEEAHLALLNEASGGGDSASGGTPADTPQASAAELLAAFDRMRKSDEDPILVARLGEAIKSYIRVTLPGHLESLERGGDSEAVVAYRVGRTDVTGAVRAIEPFIADLERSEKDDALCEAFLQALSAMREAGEKDAPDIVPFIDQIKDDFVTIHDSGIGFDELMRSLIRERFDAVLAHADRIEIGGGGAFFIKGENVSDIIRTMKEFIGSIITAELDSDRSEAFISGINILKDLAGTDSPELMNAIERIQDDFITIHESGIGFDQLMQSLIEERFTALLTHLDRGQAPGTVYQLGGRDVGRQVGNVLQLGRDLVRLAADQKAADAFLFDLRELAEAAEAAGRTELGVEIAQLIQDAALLFNSGVGIDANMSGMVGERLERILGNVEKIVPGPRIESAETDIPEAAATAVLPPVPETGAPSVSSPGPAREGAKPGGGHELSGKTLRVAEEKVDHFMSFVGELIITGEVFAYIQKKLEQFPEVRKVAQEFKNANLSFSDLSSNLQKSLMEVRRVPLKSVLQKLHRIVRDTSTQLGKKIELRIVGEDVQIDKSLLEGLESPLVHMVRNSVDHGVEMPGDRKAAGKSEEGHVSIIATATEERFSLVIKDDGKGLDIDAIKNKAVSKGMLSEDAARNMPDKEAFRLIFNAGLSTAKVVTDVSGRGVGMDVVLSNIIRMNGNIVVDSARGEGSTFTILLPMTVTLTVIDGLVARIGDQHYIIPLSDVRESVRPTPEQIHTLRGSQEVLNVRGELHPLVHLDRVLGIAGDPAESILDSTVVLVQGKKASANAAFLVDEIIGQQSVVVKELGKEFENIKCIKGGSILGDGRVGLVLNVPGILVEIGADTEEV